MGLRFARPHGHGRRARGPAVHVRAPGRARGKDVPAHGEAAVVTCAQCRGAGAARQGQEGGVVGRGGCGGAAGSLKGGRGRVGHEVGDE